MNEKTQEFETQKFGWWIKILTNKPNCIYYFGAFDNYWEAESCKKGYIQDLEEEKAKIVDIQIHQCQPRQLTIPITLFSA